MSQPTSERCEPGSFCTPKGPNIYDLFALPEDYEPLMFGMEVGDASEEGSAEPDERPR